MPEKFHKRILDSMSDGVYSVGNNRRVTYWNKASERLSGYSAKEVLGKSCADNILRHIDDEGNELCVEGCPLAATILDGKSREANVYMHHKYGHRVPVTVRASPMRDDDGHIVGAVEIFQDNSVALNVLKELEILQKEILTDQLTEIGNRRYAELTLEKFAHSMQESKVPFGVIFVDIDHFKNVNDTWGHAVGDKVLTMVGKTLLAGLRPLDVACRWGGEEFAILIPNTTEKALLKIGQRLRMLVEHSWIVNDGEQIRVTASFGAALSRNAEPPSSVLERADKQLYISKKSGRNCVNLECS